jgi:PAS domain S-box-containing protein
LKQVFRDWWIGAIALLCGIITAAAAWLAYWRLLNSTEAISAQALTPSLHWILLTSGIVTSLSVATILVVLAFQRRQTERRLHSIFKGAAIGIGLDSLDGTIIESNPALCKLLGYTQAELAQMTFAQFSHPDDVAVDVELFQEMIAGRRDSYQIEKRQLRKDGSLRWVRLTNSLVRDRAGKPQYTIAVAEDITQLKQAEAALQQSEMRFRVVAETANCAFLVYQGDRLRYVNPAAEAITGYSRDELMTIPFWNLAHPDYQDLVRQRGLARQRGEQVPRRYEIKIVTKSGQERWVDLIGGALELDGQPAALATAYDITERKQAEAQVLQAANRDRLLSEIALRIRSSLSPEEILNTTVAEVRQFLQADRVLVTYLEPGGGCRTIAESADPKWQSALGWVTDVHDVEEIKALFQPHTVRVVCDAEAVEKTPFLLDYYKRCQVKAGMGWPIMLEGELFGVLIVNQCSAPREWQPFEIDLLEKLGTQVEIAIQQGQLYQQLRALAKNLECQVEERTLELQQRMQDLQRLNQVKDILLHAVSHDLRTPVQGMSLLLKSLCAKRGAGAANRVGRSTGEATEAPCASEDVVRVPYRALAQMLETSDRQLSLLDSLMNHPYGEHCPPLVLSRETVSLHQILQQAMAKLAPRLSQNQTQIMCPDLTHLPLLKVDAAKVQQVLENLLCNAIKHNPPGRTIRLTADVIDLAGSPIQKDLSSDSGSTSTPYPDPANLSVLRCSVVDDGEGMSVAQCDRLFQLYVRGVDNQHLTGLGLGLHRCQQIIHAHGGEIGVNSRVGAGSEFWFTLPL